MALPLQSRYCHVVCAQIYPKTVSQSGELNHFVSKPNTKSSSHSHNLSISQHVPTPLSDNSSPLFKHNHNIFTEEQFGMKVEEARRLLTTADPVEDVVMVDAIQRLGIDYYFQDQIEAVLHKHQHHYHRIMNSASSHDVSLGFRLLRQHGFNVSADVFDKFMDRKEVRHDMKGLMGLFEASHLATEGEDVLEEIGEFSKQLLSAYIAGDGVDVDHYEARIAENRLANPFHKSLARFIAQDYLRTNHQLPNVLKELQILDSNMVKSIHQQEILLVSKWWKELGLAEELQFVRDEPVKWYMWPMAMVTDPSMSAQRVELTKPISLIYIIDDIFDVHGTLHQLTLFTDVVQRWDLNSLEQLPDYMKVCFKALNDTTNELSYRIYRDHGWNPVQSLRLAWASLCKAFLVEAQWFHSGKLPKAEEYLENGIVSSGVHVALVHLFFLLGQNVTNQSAQLINHMPSIISSTATILRLWDDLGSAQDENQEGCDGSYLKYYMSEHEGVTMAGARAHVDDKISKAWKELNRACISPTSPYSKSYKEGCLNLARMVPLMYNYDENHQLPVIKKHMRSMLE